VGQRSNNETSGSKAADASVSASGFTPIELLMATTLLGIVIATLVPQMLSTSEEARRNTLLLRLHSVRGQINQFRQDHNDRFPAEGRNSAEEFVRELTASTNRTDSRFPAGRTVPDPHGKIPPVNPYTQKSEVLVVPGRLKDHHYSGSGRHGWAYSSTTGEFRSNLSPNVTDRSGRLINQL
jgi:general secretion pathway protein G